MEPRTIVTHSQPILQLLSYNLWRGKVQFFLKTWADARYTPQVPTHRAPDLGDAERSRFLATPNQPKCRIRNISGSTDQPFYVEGKLN